MSLIYAPGSSSFLRRGPSRHLSWSELRCHDEPRTPYPYEWRPTRAIRLAEMFEAVRALLGGTPLTITSGYRTPEYNRRPSVGGTPGSQHVPGRAVDVAGFTGSYLHAWRLVRDFADTDEGQLIGAIGAYPSRGFLHLDSRARPGRLIIFGTPMSR